MATFVKLPSGRIVNTDLIIEASWYNRGGLREPPPRDFRVYLQGYGEMILQETDYDSLALARYLDDNSYAAT